MISGEGAGEYKLVPTLEDKNASATKRQTIERCAPIEHFDGLEDATASSENEEQPLEFTVRVTAPSDLPERYLFTVKTNTGEITTVRVPEGGVSKGDVFTVECSRSQQVTGRWWDDIFDIRTNVEGNFCWVAACCPVVAWAAVIERVYQKRVLFALIIGLYFLDVVGRAVLDPDTEGFIMFRALALGVTLSWCVAARRAVRERYRIPGNCLSDCCCVLWCSCCAVRQIFRHMTRSGEAPRTFTRHPVVEVV